MYTRPIDLQGRRASYEFSEESMIRVIRLEPEWLLKDFALSFEAPALLTPCAIPEQA